MKRIYVRLTDTLGFLNIRVYRKPSQIERHLLFDSHRSLGHKLGVTKTLRDRVKTTESSGPSMWRKRWKATDSTSGPL